MNIRKAKYSEIPAIEEIYASARAFMREHGNAAQWGNTYPAKADIERDFELDRLYVCEGDGRLLGVFCFFEGEDPTYLNIYDGSWLNDAPYGVIHRIAVSSAAHGKGVARAAFDYCCSLCNNLRIDTHRDNLPMQKALEKNGFVRCGIIYLENGDERIAFQKCRRRFT